MILLTSGCSFSTVGDQKLGNTWPIHLSGYFSGHCSEAHPGQCNELISRRLIYRLNHLLKDTTSDNLFVCVMWTDPSRTAIYKETEEQCIDEDYQFFPTHKHLNKGWIKVLSTGASPTSKNYYKNFYDPVNSQIKTFDYILLTQLFLKNKGIKYIMCSISDSVLKHSDYEWKTHVNTTFYYDLLDCNKFIFSGLSDWASKHTKPYTRLPDGHPSPEQHKEYTEKVLVPFINSRYDNLLNQFLG